METIPFSKPVRAFSYWLSILCFFTVTAIFQPAGASPTGAPGPSAQPIAALPAVAEADSDAAGIAETQANTARPGKKSDTTSVTMEKEGSMTSSIQTAENGTIAGTIVDAQTGEPVIGANVAITGTTRGAATDLDGRYTIGNLSPDTYSVTVTYISYAKKTVTGVEVESGKATTLNIELQPETVGLDEITVSAEVNSSSEAGLLSIQRKSTAVQDGLSSEQLSKIGDGDVGAAMKRVTGVTVRNGKDVFVRGLGNRYSNVQLNGSQVPSTNPNKKEAPTDLFDSGLVENIMVQKTYTADQFAEFSGGSVKIQTKEFPYERNASVSYSTGFNTRSTFKHTPTSRGSATDFLGFDSGKRNLPVVLENQRVNNANAAEVAEELHDDWDINNSKKGLPSQKVSLNYANQFNEDQLPIGVVGNVSYSMSRELEQDKATRFVQYIGEQGANFMTDYSRNDGVENSKISGMLNLFVKPSPVTKIGLKTMYSNEGTDQKTIIEGPYQNGVTRQTVLDFDRRSVLSTTLEAESHFDQLLGGSTLSGQLSYNRAQRLRPDRRTTRYNLTGDQYSFQAFGDNNGHFFSNQDDNNYSGNLKYVFTPRPFVEVAAGGNVIMKDRTFKARRITYRDQVPPFAIDLSDESAGTVLSDENIANGIFEMTETTQYGLTQSDWYNGYQNIYAGFVTTEWNLLDNLSLELGGRIEQSLQTIDVPMSMEGDYEEVSRVEQTDFLPAVNVSYSLSNETNLRAAYSRTLARPAFREISNFNFADFMGGRRIYGNPDLQQTNITNYDLRLETYPGSGELFAVSAFYKDFKNPIELFYRLTESNEVFYDNAPEADLYGIEIEGRKNLLERLQVVANASYIYSESRMGEEAANRLAHTERPMVGQSPFIVNASVFYLIPGWNMDLSLSYNTFGKRIITVGKNVQQYDEYEQSFHDLGAKIGYSLGQIDLSLEAGNLLNQTRTYKQGPATTFSYRPGMTFSLGASLEL